MYSYQACSQAGLEHLQACQVPGALARPNGACGSECVHARDMLGGEPRAKHQWRPKPGRRGAFSGSDTTDCMPNSWPNLL